MSLADPRVDEELERRLGDARRGPIRPHEAQALNELQAMLFHRTSSPATVDRYRLLERLGRGGAGSVYRALDPRLDRHVAVKLLHADAQARREARARFAREGRALAQLSHPNIVTVFDVGIHRDEQDPEGTVFIVMELVDGPDLSRWLGESRREWEAVRDVFVQAGRGLAAAHGAGFVHRDFKPSNVLIGPDGRARVADFGLVATGSGDASGEASPASEPLDDDALTRAGRVMGTPSYMAPEVLRGEKADFRSDQFSFCVAMCEGLFGARPFTGTTRSERERSIERGAGLPAETPVPRRIVRAIERGLRPDPADRWPAMDPLLAALEDRRGAARVWWGAALVAAVGLGVGLSARDRAMDRALACSGGSERIADVWNPARRDRLRAAFTARDLGPRFETLAPRIDAYRDAWSNAFESNCTATRVTGEQTPTVHALRSACLDARRDELDKVLTLLDDADADTLGRADDAVGGLASISSCEANAVLRDRVTPPEPALEDAVGALRSQLREVKALEDLGRYDDGLALAQRSLELARDSGYPPVLAEALLRTGILYSVAGQRDLAETTLAEGYWTALAAGHDRFAVANAIQLIMVVGTQPGRLDDGIAWGQHASALIERSDIAPVQEGHLLNNLGLALYLQGRHEDALESFDSALEIQTATLGPEDPELANIHNNKGNALVELDQLSLAATEYERAIDIRVKALGPDHPRLISSLGNLGAVQLRRDEIESARASFERALALTSEALGDRHPRAIGLISNLGSLEVEAGHEHRAIELFERSVALAAEADRPYDAALALTNLGLIYADRGELERARSSLQRAFDLTREALGDEHAETLRRRGYLADVARREGRLETARAELSLVIARLEESTSREHPSLAFPLWSLAELELGRGDSAAASAHTGRGLDVLGDTGTQTGLRARLQFTQARVHLLDHDLASARRLGEQARATLDAGVAGSDARFRARLDQWLATAGPE